MATENVSTVPEYADVSEDIQLRRMELDWEKQKFRTKLFAAVFFTLTLVAGGIIAVYISEMSASRDDVRFLANRMRSDVWEVREGQSELVKRLARLELRQRNADAVVSSLKASFLESQQVMDSLLKERRTVR